MENEEETNMKEVKQKDNKILKTGTLIVLVLATQLFSMFVYERYIQRSTMQRIIDKQHAMLLLVEEYKEKNILPKTFISDWKLAMWRKLDISDPSAKYEDLISEMEEKLKEGYFWSNKAKEELEQELEKAKRNKKELIQLFKNLTSILTS